MKSGMVYDIHAQSFHYPNKIILANHVITYYFVHQSTIKLGNFTTLLVLDVYLMLSNGLLEFSYLSLGRSCTYNISANQKFCHTSLYNHILISTISISLSLQNVKTFKDVKGCDDAKQELEEVVEYLKNPSKFTRLGGKLPKV